MYKKLFILVFSTLIPTILLAQKAEGSKPIILDWGGVGFVFGGLAVSEYQQLSENLNQSDLPDISEAPGYQVGGGGFLLLETQWVITGQGYGAFFPATSANGIELDYRMGGGGLNAGYVIWNTDLWLLFPTVGLGGIGSALEITNDSAGSIAFGGHPIAPGSSATFQLGTAYVDFNLNLFKTFSRKPYRLSGPAVGLSVGYQLGAINNSWSTRNGDRLMGLDNDRINMFYLRFHLGGGGFTGKGKKR